MIVSKKQEFIKNELEAIYEEFYTSVNQMILLERFLKSLVAIANDETPHYNLETNEGEQNDSI